LDFRGNFKVAIVGYGYWGPNLVRNFTAAEGAVVSHVCDLNAERVKKAASTFPAVAVTQSLEDVLSDPTVDLIAVATPVSTHHKLALLALKAGKHVMVEKPLTSSAKLARDIVATAERCKRQVFVDHTFIFTPAVQKMREIYKRGDLGRLLYYDSMRVNLGLFQHDVNVVWDLVPHDVAILDFLLDGRMPVSASCTGVAHFGAQHADLAYLTLKYDDDFVAHINVNWLAPVKVRQILLCGDRRMLVYDDNSASEKIKLYDSGVNIERTEDVYQALVQYRIGDILVPRLDTGEALEIEAGNIVAALRGTARPVCDGHAGARVVSVLEAADASLGLGGEPVSIEGQRAGANTRIA
jgi:predicted dehydrogenase